MNKENFIESMDKDLNELKNDILYFFEKDKQYAEKLLNWIIEIGIKNKIIDNYKEKHKINTAIKDKEMVRRRRQEVFWIDFGSNIGSEFNYVHFCVVIKEFTYTALVVPISTVKENDAEWKSDKNLIINIDVIDDLPNEKKECYAMVNQMKAVSKQRLSDYKHNGKFIKVKLSDEQMDKIDTEIKKLIKKC